MRPVCLVRSCALAAVLVACRTPTEITLHVDTDEPCAAVVDTTIAAGAHMTSTTQCQNGAVGTLVLTPSGAKDDQVDIRVVLGTDGGSAESCDEHHDYAGCIVARRRLRYVPHERLELPIHLRASCLGQTCNDDPTQTCIDGACVSAVIADPGACTDPKACELSSDGGVDATLSDAAQDAGPGDAPIQDAAPDAPDASGSCAPTTVVTFAPSLIGYVITDVAVGSQRIFVALKGLQPGVYAVPRATGGALELGSLVYTGGLPVEIGTQWTAGVPYWLASTIPPGAANAFHVLGDAGAQIGPATIQPGDVLVLGSDEAYWSNGPTIMRDLNASLTPYFVAAAATRGNVAWLGFNTPYIYYATANGQVSRAFRADGGADSTFNVSDTKFRAVGGTSVVYTTTGVPNQVNAQPLGGGPNVVVATIPATEPIMWLDADDTYAYILTNTSLYQATINAATPNPTLVDTFVGGARVSREQDGCVYVVQVDAVRRYARLTLP